MTSLTFLSASSMIRRRKRGVALLLVLACLVLITVLILAFLASISTEVQSSKFYANGSSVKLLAQSSVDMVMSEIRDATANPALCWASQPGMIRTFDTSGAPAQYYKLYSDCDMTGTGAFDYATTGVTGNAIPTHWYNQQGIYTDLNQPLSVSGTNRYPILDGDAADLTTMTGTTGIAGFSLTSAPADPSSANKAPMPVKWLYVLKGGQVIAPTYVADSGSVTTTVTFPAADPGTGATLPTPTTANPIIGRMAFWTDDESCKVNINTASEAANPWDTPRMYTTYDKFTMSLYQPIQHEYQRYPGHPATVCLSTVFGNWLPVPVAGPTSITSATYASQLKPYYDLIPRIVAGVGESVSAGVGSTTLAGTSSQAGTAAPGESGTISVISTPVLTPDTDRLYDSIDELVFAPNRTANNSAITQQDLEEAKFFITAHSRAPDVNLFNQPRISMWPISSLGTGMPYRSPADQLIANCTTSNNHIYYFQRGDPNDPYNDLPATGATTGVARNRTLLEYLRYLTKQPIPGFGGSFANKYNSSDTLTSGTISGKEIDQILTEIFDYIRSTNTRDQSIATSTSGSTSNPVTPYTVPFNTQYGAGNGQVMPVVDSSTGTRGFGRFPTLQQAALLFYVSNDNQPSSGRPLATQIKAFLVLSLFDPSLGYPYSIPWYQVQVAGLSNLTWDGINKMFPAAALTPDPASMTFPYGGALNQEPMVGGTIGMHRVMYNLFNNSTGTGPFFSQPYPVSNPSNLPLSPASPAGLGIAGIPFPGGTITVNFYKTLPATSPASATTKGTVSGTAVQSITLTFPAGNFPIPDISPAPTTTPPSGLEHVPSMTGTTHNPAWELWSNRYNWLISTSANFGYNCIVSNNDVIRAVIASPGDMRLIAARQMINATDSAKLFSAHPAYSTNVNMAHNLETAANNPIYEASLTASQGSGSLVPLNYWLSTTTTPSTITFPVQTNDEYKILTSAGVRWPDVPPVTGGVVAGGSGSSPGDWDNGIANFKDGAYINKADEGDYYVASGNNYPYYTVFGGSSRVVGQTFFSPNRMMPSAGMLGSLPTGVLANKPWQTLLFRPGPAGHPGLGIPANGPSYTTPPDSLLMDLFTMPVVEPYAISEPLSTAGRINMNYQILPFTYITRNTGVQAVLKSVQEISIPDNAAANYKQQESSASNPNGSNSYRFALNIPATLTEFDARFANKDVFRSPAEICSIDLVPNDTGADGDSAAPTTPTRTNMDTYWSTHRLTGDNSRERPYANIYPLLTTKSNSYTIHFRVETLQPVQGPNTDPTKWREGTDVITGEYRGSQTIERYIDPNDTAIPDYATLQSTTASPSLDSLYKFRVVSVKQFAP